MGDIECVYTFQLGFTMHGIYVCVAHYSCITDSLCVTDTSTYNSCQHISPVHPWLP